jgi:hypothetical protein
VDAAIYSRPHFLEEDTLAFIMRDRLTHHNLTIQSLMPHSFSLKTDLATTGKRLFLKKIREEENPELVEKIKRRRYTDENQEPRFLVYFHPGKGTAVDR